LFALDLEWKRTENEQKAQDKPTKQNAVKPQQLSSVSEYVIDPKHPPLPVSDLISSFSSMFAALFAVSRLDSLPVSVSNWLAQTYGLLFTSQVTHPHAPMWLETLMAAVPASSLTAGEARWLQEATPWPAYQDALSTLQAPTLEETQLQVAAAESAAAASSWRLPSRVTRFRMLAFVWFRHFGRVDSYLIDGGQSRQALAKIFVYFSSFLAQPCLHENDFLLTLLKRLSTHFLCFQQPICNDRAIQECHVKVVAAFKAFVTALPIIQRAPWSRLPADASDSAVSEAMEAAIRANELVWTTRDDQLADAFFTTIHWFPLSIECQGHSARNFEGSRVFVPLYAAYLARLAVRFGAELQHAANSTFAAVYTPLRPAVARGNGILWHKHAHPLLHRTKGEETEEAAETPSNTDENTAAGDNQGDEDEDEEEEEEEEEEQEVQDEEEEPNQARSKASLSCRVCARSLALLPHYACVGCRYYVCLDCGDPSAVHNLLYVATRAMFLHLSTKYRWFSGPGWPLEHARLRSCSSTGGFIEERLHQTTHWIRPILPLLQPFLLLDRRDSYPRLLLKTEPNPAAYREIPFEPSVSVGLAHDPAHTILFDAKPLAFICAKCHERAAGGSNCSYWCPVCDRRCCIPCAEWRPDARHSNAAVLPSHKAQWETHAAGASSTSLVPPAFPQSALPREISDGLLCGPCLLILYDYVDLLKEKGTAGPEADRIIDEFNHLLQESTQPNRARLPPWHAMCCYLRVWQHVQEFGVQHLGGQLDAAVAQIALACLVSESILARVSALPLLLLIKGWIELESTLKPFLLTKARRSEFGSALLRLLFTTSPWNAQPIQDASSLLLSSSITLDYRASLDVLLYICTEPYFNPSQTVLLAAPLRTFPFLLAHAETVGLVYAYVRRLLPSLSGQPLLQLAGQFGWRMQSKGDTEHQELYDHSLTLLRMIQDRLAASFGRCTSYAAAVIALPAVASPSSAPPSPPAISPEAGALIRRMLKDKALLGELRTLRQWLKSTLVSWESIFQQEKLSEMGTPVLGFILSTPLFQSLTALLCWSIRHVPLVTFLPPTSPYHVDASARGALVSDFVCMLFDILNWCATVPTMHATLVEPNVAASIEACILCHLPTTKAFEPEFRSVGDLESVVLSRAASAVGSTPVQLPLILDGQYMSITCTKAQYADMSFEELRIKEQEQPGEPSDSSAPVEPAVEPAAAAPASLVVPTGPLHIPANGRALTDSASRLLLRLLSLGLTRPMVGRALRAESALLLRALLRVLEPILRFFESLVAPAGAAAPSPQRAADGKSFGVLRLSGLINFVQQLQATYSPPHLSKSLKQFAEAPLPAAPSWELYRLLPPLVGVFVQLSQLDDFVFPDDPALQRSFGSFCGRVESLWPVWAASLAVVPNPSMSHSLLAAHAVLNRVIARRAPSGQGEEGRQEAQVRDIVDLWRAMYKPRKKQAEEASLSSSDSSSAVTLFFRMVLAPRLYLMPLSTSARLPLSNATATSSLADGARSMGASSKAVQSYDEFIAALRSWIFEADGRV
jgi:hypothetical protein